MFTRFAPKTIFNNLQFTGIALFALLLLLSCQPSTNNNSSEVPPNLQHTGKMEFWELYTAIEALGNQSSKGPLVQLNEVLKENPKFYKKTDSLSTDSTSLLGLFSMGEVQDDKTPFIVSVKVSDTTLVMEILHSSDAQQILPPNAFFAWGNETLKADNGISYCTLYMLKASDYTKTAILTNTHITEAFPFAAYDGNGYGISMNFDKKGTEIWQKMTAKNIGKCIAMCIDNKVFSAPKVQGEISGGATQISGSYSAVEAKELAQAILNAK